SMWIRPATVLGIRVVLFRENRDERADVDLRAFRQVAVGPDQGQFLRRQIVGAGALADAGGDLLAGLRPRLHAGTAPRTEHELTHVLVEDVGRGEEVAGLEGRDR